MRTTGLEEWQTTLATVYIICFKFQSKENKGLIHKVLEIDNLKEQLVEAEKSKSLIERLQKRISELETEVEEVQNVLTDSQAETKIALESMEKERKDKDEVW